MKCVKFRASSGRHYSYLLLALAVLTWATDSWGAIRYVVTDLGSLGGASVATSINNLGQVVGNSEPGPGAGGSSSKGFVWTYSKGIQPLTGLGGDLSQAYDINDHGQIVGAAETNDFRLHAALWSLSGGVTDLNPAANRTSMAAAINNNGRAVLQVQTIGATGFEVGTSMFLWDAQNGHQDYGYLNGTEAIAWDINDSDSVALMWSAMGINTFTPYQWNPQFGLWFLTNQMLDSSYSGWPTNPIKGAVSTAINDDGFVAGSMYFQDLPGRWRAFSWTYTTWESNVRPLSHFTEIGTLGEESLAQGMNNERVVVGTSRLAPEEGQAHDAQGFDWHAFIFSGWDLQDLNDLLVPNDSDWLLLGASDINDQGQIVGWGINPQGEQHAYLLNPVPEPAGLLGIGLLVLPWLRRR
ncbi:MAG: DUF3466 family protein [Phycisphaeraceae bacterium]|nr:DUF3466 family protein [Phycisphaeraceae bacterium]